MSTAPNNGANEKLTVYLNPDLEDIVPGFIENRHRDVQKIETALRENDLTMVAMIGHRMKGDGGGYGFDAISIMGTALEQAAAREDRDAIRRHTDELVDFLARVTVVYRG